MKRAEKIIIALLAVIAIELAVFGGAVLWRGISVDIEMVEAE